MTLPIFWVCWDYGQGGVWALVRASSAEEVRSRFPQLEVFETAPTFLNEETREIVSRSGVQDLDAAPSGWLQDLVPPPSQLISSSARFQALLKIVQRQLRNGVLKQYSAGHSDLPPVEIPHLPSNGPWPDVIEADFIDARGHTYHLFVDCYHGNGVWGDPTSIGPAGLSGASRQNGKFEELVDWEFDVREISTGVYRATGKDSVGRQVVIEDTDPDECLLECRSAALIVVRGR